MYPILKNKYFWFVVGGIIILLLAYRYLPQLWAKFQYSLLPPIDDTQSYQISDTRKAQLRDIASFAYSQIFSGWGESASDSLTQINALNDNELKYLVSYYNSYLSTDGLYNDIDNEVMFQTDIDEKLMVRLSTLKLQ